MADIDTIDTTVQSYLDTTTSDTDWRSVVNGLCDFLISEGHCFSSGELARWLRQYRKDLRFSVPRLGEHVRDAFYAGTMTEYPDDGSGLPAYPSQVPRQTQGLGRTPAGTQVFVYCPDQTAGFGHNFEVDIPRPGDADTSYPDASLVTPVVTPASPTVGLSGVPVPTSTQAPAPAGVSITGAAKPLVELKAKVHDDRRLCVPRAAFEAYVHFCGQPMKGGDPVFVKVETDEATITLTDPGDGASSYDLSTSRGRVLFPAPPGETPFTPGDVYLVNITPNGLTVDLTQTV